MLKTLLAISLSILLFSPALSKKTASTFAPVISKTATIELEKSGTPSLQIAVAKKGRITFSGAYGFADIEQNVPANENTLYRTASVSKWMTATATLMLVESGKLKIDAPIQNYCQSFPRKPYPISSRQLLTHTSGIRHYKSYSEELEQAQNQSERDKIQLQQLRETLGNYTRYTDVLSPLQNFKDDPLLFQPSQDWSYSSHAYRVLACVIEQASKQQYRALMTNSVFRPSDMMSTTEDDAWQVIPHRSRGYRLQKNEPARRADMRDVSENLPAGGHLSTASDLVRFSQALANGKLISPTTFNMMTTPLFKDDPKASGSNTWRDAIPSKFKYAYGTMLFRFNGETWVGHTGRQAGASAIVIHSIERDISIAVMTNAKGWNGYISFMQQLVDIVTPPKKLAAGK